MAIAMAMAGAVLSTEPAAQTGGFSTADDWRSVPEPSIRGTPAAGAPALDRTGVGRQPGIATTPSAAGRISERTAVDTQPGIGGIPPPQQTGTRAFDRTEVDPDFRLGPGDVLLVSVLEDPTLDTEVLVRPDGMITVPLAGTIRAAGRTPEEVAAAIRQELAPDFVEPPTVVVALRVLAPVPPEEELLTIYIIGQVNRPGPFLIEEPVGFLQALTLAGGLGIFADAEEIQVRQVDEWGVEKVLVVDYEAIEEDRAIVPKILLDDGDTIVVPERGLFD